ncbi:asparaginyl-tRNA synthetase [Umbelopsis sp. WA50703]
MLKCMNTAVRSLHTARQILPKTIKSILQDQAVSDAQVSVNGWIRSVRSQKQVSFANVNDGSNLKGIQAILTPEQAKNLTTGASVQLKGKLVASPGHEQQRELQVEHVQVLGECDSTYPLQKKRHTLEFLREIGHLRSRGNTGSAVLRLRNAVLLGFQKFFEQAECFNVHTPIITSHDCEGGGEVFKVLPASDYEAQKARPTAIAPSEFFRKPVYLTVSGQLHAEILASSLSRVYTMGPVFRAEESQTSRHLAEFWMMEAELAFINNLNQLLDFTEDCIVSTTNYVLENAKEELEFFNRWTDKTLLERLEKTVMKPFIRMTYTEAIEVLQKAQQSGKVKFEFPVTWGSSLQSEHERYLATKHFQHPVFVTNYPSSLKPFYMRVDETTDSKSTVGCFDLLIPSIGELIGGSMREERYDVLRDKMIESKMDLDEYKWYLDLRRYGTVPHGGFGLGLERYMLWITGLESVRDVVPMPRHVGSCRY